MSVVFPTPTSPVTTVMGDRVITPYSRTEYARRCARDQNMKSGSGSSVNGRSLKPKNSIYRSVLVMFSLGSLELHIVRRPRRVQVSDADGGIMSGLRQFCNVLKPRTTIRPIRRAESAPAGFGLRNSVTQSFIMLKSSRSGRQNECGQNRGSKCLRNLAIAPVSVNLKLGL